MLYRRPWANRGRRILCSDDCQCPCRHREETHARSGWKAGTFGKGLGAGTPRVGRRWRTRPSPTNRINAGGCARFRFLEFYGAQGLLEDAKKSELPAFQEFCIM